MVFKVKSWCFCKTAAALPAAICKMWQVQLAVTIFLSLANPLVLIALQVPIFSLVLSTPIALTFVKECHFLLTSANPVRPSSIFMSKNFCHGTPIIKIFLTQNFSSRNNIFGSYREALQDSYYMEQVSKLFCWLK